MRGWRPVRGDLVGAMIGDEISQRAMETLCGPTGEPIVLSLGQSQAMVRCPVLTELGPRRTLIPRRRALIPRRCGARTGHDRDSAARQTALESLHERHERGTRCAVYADKGSSRH